jgi:hypothetical protein
LVEPYLYAACEDAGVLIAETTAVGIQEPSPQVGWKARPTLTVVHRAAWRDLSKGATVFDAMGRRVTRAKPGVYFVIEAQAQAQAQAGQKPQAIRKVVLVQ